MTDSGEPGVRVEIGDRIEVEINSPIPSLVKGVSIDNVHHVETPADLVASPGETGVRTEWDASSLDSAISWLEAHANYLDRLAHEMAEIQNLMGGANAGWARGGEAVDGAKSPLGSFHWAQELAYKHATLYDSTEANIRTLSDNLYAAARALRKVKENYETVEHANAMSAEEMARIFDASRAGEV